MQLGKKIYDGIRWIVNWIMRLCYVAGGLSLILFVIAFLSSDVALINRAMGTCVAAAATGFITNVCGDIACNALGVNNCNKE